LKYELLEEIVFEGIVYPPTCCECGEVIETEAIVFPELKKIFCPDTICAAEWFTRHCRYINITDERRGAPCMLN